MEKKTEQQKQQPSGDSRQEEQVSLNHGVLSLVSMDNPDDSQLGAEAIQRQKRGSRR